MSQSLALPRLFGIFGIVILATAFATCWGCGVGGGSNRVQSVQHTVALSWTASVSDVAGYNIYRGTQAGGPYPVKLNPSLDPGTTFSDSTVQSGVTYYYVVRAEDANHFQSSYSNEVIAVIPYP